MCVGQPTTHVVERNDLGTAIIPTKNNSYLLNEHVLALDINLAYTAVECVHLTINLLTYSSHSNFHQFILYEQKLPKKRYENEHY